MQGGVAKFIIIFFIVIFIYTDLFSLYYLKVIVQGIFLLTSGTGHAHMKFKREKADGTTMVVGGT